MYRLTCLFGHPDDPAAFQEHYRNVHIPLGKQLPGIKRWIVGLCETQDGKPPPFYMIAELCTATREDMEQLLASPQGQTVAADVANFATGGATIILYQEEVIHPERPCDAH
ncbi:EthD family reductase [Streptomyces sp. NPDC007205]|uniref:EthD family reductase n=1 Tax=Streptomyces sp. NPDC007205 TaxID=3154316 RepID=UPI0033FCF847